MRRRGTSLLALVCEALHKVVVFEELGEEVVSAFFVRELFLERAGLGLERIEAPPRLGASPTPYPWRVASPQNLLPLQFFRTENPTFFFKRDAP